MISLVLLILATIAAFVFMVVGFDWVTVDHPFGWLGAALFLYLLSLWPWGTRPWRRTPPA